MQVIHDVPPMHDGIKAGFRPALEHGLRVTELVGCGLTLLLGFGPFNQQHRTDGMRA